MPTKYKPVENNQDWKMVFCIRTDLKMGKGKIAAQCAHAALGTFSNAIDDPRFSKGVHEVWQKSGAKKIALKCASKELLHQLEKKALLLGLVTHMVIDAGCTQITPNTETVLGIGPAPEDIINQVTHDLKLI